MVWEKVHRRSFSVIRSIDCCHSCYANLCYPRWSSRRSARCQYFYLSSFVAIPLSSGLRILLLRFLMLLTTMPMRIIEIFFCCSRWVPYSHTCLTDNWTSTTTGWARSNEQEKFDYKILVYYGTVMARYGVLPPLLVYFSAPSHLQ